jgi:hypothetical protein
MSLDVLMGRGGVIPSDFANQHRGGLKLAKLVSAQNATGLLKGSRPLDAGGALLNVSYDLIDEVRPSAGAEVANDRISDGGAAVKRRKVREVMHGIWSETFCDGLRVLNPAGFEVCADHPLDLLLNRIGFHVVSPALFTDLTLSGAIRSGLRQCELGTRV